MIKQFYWPALEGLLAIAFTRSQHAPVGVCHAVVFTRNQFSD